MSNQQTDFIQSERASRQLFDKAQKQLPPELLSYLLLSGNLTFRHIKAAIYSNGAYTDTYCVRLGCITPNWRITSSLQRTTSDKGCFKHTHITLQLTGSEASIFNSKKLLPQLASSYPLITKNIRTQTVLLRDHTLSSGFSEFYIAVQKTYNLLNL